MDRPGRAAIAAALAAAAAFANGLRGPFQFDDWNVVVADPRVQSLGAWWRAMPGIRPFLKLTFAANHAAGLGPAGFHALNLAIHAASAALVALAVARFERREAANREGSAPAGGIPLLAALLFALHPVQVEAVTYVSGRSASLAGALVLGSLLAHLAGRDGWRPGAAHLLSVALFALALGTREQAMVLPAALVAVEAFDPRRPFRLREALRATAGHWLALAAAAGAVAASPVYRRLLAESLSLRGPAENLLAQLGGLAWLAGQVVRPDLLDADPLLPARARPDAATVAATLGVAALLGGALWLRRRRPGAGLALLWTVLWAAPAGWWIPRAEPANDRQLYLALLGPAWLLARAAFGALRPRVAWAAGLALSASLALATASRNRVYADEVTFWTAATERSPRNARAWNNLGFALAGRCRPAEAERAFRRALAADPGHFRAAVNLEALREGAPLEPGAARCAPTR